MRKSRIHTFISLLIHTRHLSFHISCGRTNININKTHPPQQVHFVFHFSAKPKLLLSCARPDSRRTTRFNIYFPVNEKITRAMHLYRFPFRESGKTTTIVCKSFYHQRRCGETCVILCPPHQKAIVWLGELWVILLFSVITIIFYRNKNNTRARSEWTNNKPISALSYQIVSESREHRRVISTANN